MPEDPSRTGPWQAPATVEVLPQLAGYEVLGVLGRGGMGVVYKARHLKLKRVVALKMIRAAGEDEAEALDRFRAEAEAVARLQHPNIVQIYEVGEHEGRPFFSLEYVEGGSLARKIGGESQKPRLAAQLVQTLARAVHAAHERGIIHRDLKPENVLLAGAVEAPLEQCVPKIGDFGLAKTLDDASGRTRAGAVMGTPSYMAPEQADGRVEQIGPATDVYALGGIFYELLTGQPPFRGKTVLETLDLVRKQDPLPPPRLRPRLPPDLETICLKCLRKEPAKRYASAQDLADDLQRFLDNEPIRARPVGRTERTIKWVRRRPALSLAVLTLFLILAGAAGGTWLWQQRAQKQLAYERQRQLTEQKEQEIEVDKRKEEEARRKEEAARAVHVEYYANWVKRWGHQEGIGRLTLEEARRRAVSYKFHRRGGRDGEGGLIESAERVNGHGRPTSFDPVLALTGQRNPAARSEGICSYHYHYNKEGKLLAEEARDEHGGLLYTFHYTSANTGYFEYHDRLGLLRAPRQSVYLQFKTSAEGLWTEVWNLDARGQLVASGGFWGWTVDYALNGLPLRRTYRNAQGKAVTIVDGTAGVAMRYDEQGNQTEEAYYYGPEGQPVRSLLKGCHKVRWRHDDHGNQVEQTYHGLRDELVAGTAGIARWTWRIDEHGNNTEEAYWDAGGKRTADRDGTARITARHDDAGNRTEETHFGQQDSRVATPAGWSRWTAAYDRRGFCTELAYFDVQDHPMLLQPDGYHKMLVRYDKQGNRVEERFFGVDGLPKANARGIALWKGRYDGRGRCTEEAYFGTDERPAAVAGGYACLKIGYDNQGNRNEEAYFDGRRRPVEHSDGYHKKKMRCDERGTVVEEAYFHAGDTPAVHREGYHRREVKRMLQFPDGIPYAGHTLEAVFFCDTRGQRTWHRDGYHILGRLLDPQGRVVETSHLDANNKPCLNAQGAHKARTKYDNRGHMVEVATFGVNNEPVLFDSSYARITQTFDARGRAVEMVFWVIDRKNAYLRCRRTLNPRGQLVEEAYFTDKDEPAVHRDGYHRRTVAYDARGNRTEVAFFGLDGKPTLHNNGYARLRFSYDDRPEAADLTAFDLAGKPLRVETVIDRVVGGSQAYQLGLQAGDVVVKYDGEEVVNHLRLIRRRLSEGASGPPRPLTVLRGGRSLTVSVRPGLVGCLFLVRAAPAGKS